MMKWVKFRKADIIVRVCVRGRESNGVEFTKAHRSIHPIIELMWLSAIGLEKCMEQPDQVIDRGYTISITFHVRRTLIQPSVAVQYTHMFPEHYQILN